MPNLATLHKDALSRFQRAKALVASHKETIDTFVDATVRKVFVTGGGVAGAFAEHYLSQGDDPETGLPEAKIGPAPLVLTGGLVGSGIAYAMGKSDTAKPVHAVADGLLAFGGGMETLRALRKHAAAKAAEGK